LTLALGCVMLCGGPHEQERSEENIK